MHTFDLYTSCSTFKKYVSILLYIGKYRYVCEMNLKLATEIGKCLSNQTRVQIMEWLKAPNKNFPPHDSLRNFDDGVCVTSIKNKSGLSQSTISNYLTNMEKCGLLIMKRHGKFSYLKRNEKLIKEYSDFLK